MRYFLVPDSFYEIGSYRADAIKDIESIELKYADTASCAKCHEEADSTHKIGSHSKINCQICHGPGLRHVVSPSKNNIDRPLDRKFCGKCHSKNAARPSFLSQIDTAKHNKNMNCTKCHKPHNPLNKSMSAGTSDTSKTGSSGITCVMCHDDKNTLILSGVHKTVKCESCHGAGTMHMENPADNVLPKPDTRAFCGSCHGIGIAPAKAGIKQIDIKEHNIDSPKCTDCHDPHSPFKGF